MGFDCANAGAAIAEKIFCLYTACRTPVVGPENATNFSFLSNKRRAISGHIEVLPAVTRCLRRNACSGFPDQAQFHLEDMGDAGGFLFCVCGLGPFKKIADGLREKRDPAAEVLPVHWQEQVFWERLPFVGHTAKKHGAPEFVHHGQVLLPVYLRKIVEYRRKQLVLVHAVVKSIDEQFDVFLGFYVFLHLCFWLYCDRCCPPTASGA